ncbi:group II intron maturase-specific domain-containing protein [Candidatus Tisiphia endosymbiont of Sialis lutaria]|uniref:group II intron maturase-specific domain-containing protein n=1 Tax=Candidatus Tisiphia endosymbiont of Sialis lutaria TaxID=2029164 RepID=UPI00312CA0EC
MSYFLQPKRVKYRITLVIVGSLLEVTTSPTSPELTISPEKTNITHINDGFDFLSQNIRKYKNKLIIKPSKKSIKTFLKDIRDTICTNKSMAQEELIKILNPKITGWANYHNAV